MLRIVPFLALIFWILPGFSFAQTQQVTGLSFERVLLQGHSALEIRQGSETQLLFKEEAASAQKLPFFLDGETLVLGKQGNSAVYQFKLTVSELSHLQLKGSGQIYVRPLELENIHVSLDGSGHIKLFSLNAEDDITLRLHGSGDIQIAKLICDDLGLVLSGSGNIHLGRIVAEEVDIALKGSGTITARDEGTAEQVEIDIVGSGGVSLEPVEAGSVEVNIMGAGKAFVSPVAELEVNIMGSAEVHYRGEPDIDQSILGSGTLHHVRK